MMTDQKESEYAVTAESVSDESYAAAVGADANLEKPTVKKITKISSVLTIIVSGLALFSDGYNAQIIGYMEPLFSDLYPKLPGLDSLETRLSNSYLIGEIFGMLFFGYLIDKIGRRNGVVIATIFLILGIILATAAQGESQRGMIWMMIVARGIAGFGAGGEYPVSGTGSAEAADETDYVRRKRGILVAMSTDFAIDLGFVVAGVVALIVIAAYNEKISPGIWRVCFGLGIVLPLTLFIFRIRIINSTQYRKHAMKKQIPYLLIIKRYWKPGCIVGGLLMDRIGRKQTMTLGFACWAILGFIIGGALGPIQSVFPLFVVLYGIFNSFGEMGPGVATFLCGAESFPTPVRGHFIGFAAAVGKAGAAIGTQVFLPIQNSFDDAYTGTQAVFLIGAAFAAVGGIIAWVFIPDRDRQLESEDVKFRAYLEEHGYSGVYGDSLVAELRTTSFSAPSASGL